MEEDFITPAELDKLSLQALIANDRAHRDAFAEDAEVRGLVHYNEAGIYADENGNALDESGDRL